MSADLQDGQELQTAAGVAVRVSANAYGTVMVNDAKLIAADVKTRNGVVHVIDAILTPPARDDNFAAAKDRAPPASLYPVLFRSFVMTGLFEAFLGADSFTVFAPTEESMNAALDAMFVDMDELLASPGFANIVKHHVLPSKVRSTCRLLPFLCLISNLMLAAWLRPSAPTSKMVKSS